jgi:tRNA A-37 threonylcarbamoyl transferase component Bud32
MVGAYRIERKLGQGGVGTVYAAEEPTIKKRVAIKVLRSALAEDPAMLARFEREARAVNEIRHPALIDVFGIGKLPDGRPYLVMALLSGRSLREEIDARGPLPPAEAWAIARDVASALDAVHEASVIHRDLKPDNVFLERADGGARARVRVLDFGIAKVLEPPEGERAKLTATGVPLGTPAYMAPEQWWGAGVSARSDQYALGITLHEMLAGRPPFLAEGFLELAQQHAHATPPAVPGAPEPVQAFVARLLAKAPEDRFASMAEVMEAGDRAFASVEVTNLAPALPSAPPRPAAARALARWLRLHAGVVALWSAAVVAVGYAGEGRHDPWMWFRIGGWGQWMIALFLLAGVVGLARLARRRATTGNPSLGAFWLALLPALAGAFSTYTGWRVILSAMPSFDPLQRFATWSEGTWEANAARFCGFSAAALLCLSLSALPGVSGMAGARVTLPRAPGVRPREASAAAVGLVVLGFAAALVGAPSAALVAGAAAAVLAMGLSLPTVHADTAARDELERAVAGALAVALAAAAGITRVEAREAALWDPSLTRAARVAEIVAARGERDATLAIAAASLLVVLAVEALRVRRLARLGALHRPRTATAALGTVLALGLIGDVIQHGRFIGKRDDLRAELASQFALFARLDPPPGDALDPARFAPHRATALQVTRDVVAVDGRGVARLSALGTKEGAAQVASDLNRALAQAALAQGDAGGVELSISVDREVPGATLQRLLAAARTAGVRRVELLLTRGEAPRLGKGPPEIGVVLPGDFVALPAELADDGADLGAAGRFGSLVPALIALVTREGAPVRLQARAVP